MGAAALAKRLSKLKSRSAIEREIKRGGGVKCVVWSPNGERLAAGSVEDAYMKELYPKMPVILVRSILAEKEDTRGIYRCPVYKQTERATPGFDTPGSGFVFMMQLKTKQPASKWVMAGCAMLLATD